MATLKDAAAAGEADHEALRRQLSEACDVAAAEAAEAQQEHAAVLEGLRVSAPCTNCC